MTLLTYLLVIVGKSHLGPWQHMESEFSPYSLSDKKNSLADSDLLEQGVGVGV